MTNREFLFSLSFLLFCIGGPLTGTTGRAALRGGYVGDTSPYSFREAKSCTKTLEENMIVQSVKKKLINRVQKGPVCGRNHKQRINHSPPVLVQSW